eukprot:2908185-Amphidinium_carterae.1
MGNVRCFLSSLLLLYSFSSGRYTRSFGVAAAVSGALKATIKSLSLCPQVRLLQDVLPDNDRENCDVYEQLEPPKSPNN